ncbi:MAG: 7-cyano-7-deazaguanine synthase [Vampirovibrionales bacterium]
MMSPFSSRWQHLNEDQRQTVRRLIPPHLLQLTGKAVVLLSGGVDSAVCLYALQALGVEIELALNMNYGQQAWVKEHQAVQALCESASVPLETIELPWLATLLPKGMQATATTQQQQSLANVWVPNRNGVLLNMAASYAEARGAKYVSFGANADEAHAFSDNSEQYWQWVNSTLRLSTQTGVQILVPTGPLSKTAIVELGVALGVPFEHIWSCYGHGELHCGQCTSCQHLKRGLTASRVASQQIRFAR